jgi:hypothetical protein
MGTLRAAIIVMGALLASASRTEAQTPLPPDPSGYGLYPGFYTNSGAPGYHWPVYSYPVASTPAYPGTPAPTWGDPGYYGGYRYTFNYYTHVPGVSFTHFKGYTPRYYPSQWGGVGYYGFGPYPY